MTGSNMKRKRFYAFGALVALLLVVGFSSCGSSHKAPCPAYNYMRVQ